MVVLVLVGALGVGFLVSARRAGRLAETVATTLALTPQQAVSSTHHNRLLTVQGRAAALEGASKVAPVGDYTCVWWALRARPLRRWVSGGRVPMLARELTSSATFALEDGLTRVRVAPAGLTTYGHPPSQRVREDLPGVFASGPLLPPTTRRVVSRCPELGDLVDAGRQRAMVFTEWTLREDEQVAVTGELSVDPDSGEVVLRAHRPPHRRTAIFGMTPGRDHTDVSDLRAWARRARWIGAGFTILGVGTLLFVLPALLADVGVAISDVGGGFGW